MKLDKMQEKIVVVASKMQSNTAIQILSRSMTKLMPALMIGALCSLITGLPLGDGYTEFLAKTGLSTLLSDVNTIAQLMGLWCALSIGAGIAEVYGEDRMTAGVMGLMCFLICSPLSTTVTSSAGETIAVTGVLATSNLGSIGMFAALITSAAGSSLYCWLMTKNIKIKLPDSVPEFVSKSFEGIVPGIITVLPFMVLRVIFANTSYGSLNSAIYAWVQAPLQGLGATLPAMLLVIFLTSLFWWFGLHGTLVMLSIVQLLYYPQMLENLNAFMAGTPLDPSGTVVLSYLFWFLFIQFFGGPGMLLGLDINMLLFAKSEKYKALGKLAIVPGFFNIIEPVVYGFPIVMNPTLFIPFCFGPVIYAVLGYFLMTAGIVGYPVANVAVMTIPAPIVGFLLGGGISLGIFVLVGIVYSVVIYMPFFKACDIMAQREEAANKQIEEA